MKSLLERFEKKYIPVPESGCWLWTGSTFFGGYGQIWDSERKVKEGAHRVSWKLHKGPILDGFYVLHRCDVPCCVNPDHLFLGTLTDNQNDCVRKGRHVPGMNSTLTKNEVCFIRGSLKSGSALAKQFLVSGSTISRIRTSKTWRQITSN